MPIIPASLEFAADGTPCSSVFGDIYHSSDGALGQARHVFLAGNDLPRRWQGRERFVIVETGFGLGLNLLATWAAWRADPRRAARLHFVSCELHPFRRQDLCTVHTALAAQAPEIAPLAAALQARWPALTPGLHHIHLDGERVTLSLFLGDAADGLANMRLSADAFFLDGFSPAKNPQLWSARIFHLLARLAAAEATLATWSVAGMVREGLRRAGFDCDKAPGFGGKRQMLRGRYRGPGRHVTASGHRHALVLGAGVAGSSVAERLAARGWRVDVIDAANQPGAGASGNHAGVLRPLPSLDDNRLSRLTRAGTLYALQHLAHLEELGQRVRFDPCGVLHIARDALQEDKQRAVVERHRPPAEHLRYVDREQASRIAGWPLANGGWWFPSSGWVQPPSLCRANLGTVNLDLGHPRVDARLVLLHQCAIDVSFRLLTLQLGLVHLDLGKLAFDDCAVVVRVGLVGSQQCPVLLDGGIVNLNCVVGVLLGGVERELFQLPRVVDELAFHLHARSDCVFQVRLFQLGLLDRHVAAQLGQLVVVVLLRLAQLRRDDPGRQREPKRL
ncbi:MAG TPA: tRNA (5-methylaminomethyl-2-thiouridine)(34)-methyltransferase MnmD [Pseudothauera hydrothermalis]|nr:tRNA (5-methylaminomethyl-2-thiouridine)(34)-methyltransferase MnmD [Pseudothauera hydrothermalis]